MTGLFTRPGAWLLQQAAALPDTVVMKQVAVERGTFETVTSIASGIMTLTLLALAIALIPAAWAFWRTFRRVRDMLDRVYADVMPLARHAGSIADNMDYITTSIRTDVQQVNATIASANQRLQQAARLTETRLNEFNALLQVVQQEAEQAFVSTAAAVRGVRTGAAAFGARHTTDDDFLDEGGVNDGDDDGDDEADETAEHGQREPGTSVPGTARPRVRSRRRRLG